MFYDEFVSGKIDEQKMRRIGFKWSEQLVERILLEIGGTVYTSTKKLYVIYNNKLK
jgi:hypothetical protein